MAVSVLNDVCSNIILMNYNLFKAHYLAVEVQEDTKVDINGIGSVQSLDFARIPIWMEGSYHK